MSNYKFNGKYKFTEDWFDPMIPVWSEIFTQYREKVGNIQSVLEVGCYEGRATVWLCENVLTPETRLDYQYDIIDTFEGSLEESGMEKTKERLEQDNFIENNFIHNISFFDHIKFNINKGYSQQILPYLAQNSFYDFIYVDASHRADDTFVDAYYAHKALKIGGLLIFDDYGWKDPKDLHEVNSPQAGVDMFWKLYNREYQIVYHGYQVGLLKIA
jgi:predicted O-methyltransferase YrrM